MTSIRILIADDSVVSRQMLKTCLEAVEGFEVVALASNGRLALEKIASTQPDLVILDLEMPEMDGLETLTEIRRQHARLPVIMFSALTEAGADLTIQALSLGADDYVTKPNKLDLSPEELFASVRAEFVTRIQALHRRRGGHALPSAQRLTRAQQRVDAIGIGISTGGPGALAQLLPSLPEDFPVPLLLVQHMPPVFTRYLAERLDQLSRITVCEAESGMPLLPGWAYIAPGGQHLELALEQGQLRIRLTQNPPENSCRPSVDVTFGALASQYGSHALGVIMTGMGHDGLRGCEALHGCGAGILAQDESSSTVWGMPSFVVRAGLADRILPLQELGQELIRRVRYGR